MSGPLPWPHVGKCAPGLEEASSHLQPPAHMWNQPFNSRLGLLGPEIITPCFTVCFTKDRTHSLPPSHLSLPRATPGLNGASSPGYEAAAEVPPEDSQSLAHLLEMMEEGLPGSRQVTSSAQPGVHLQPRWGDVHACSSLPVTYHEEPELRAGKDWPATTQPPHRSIPFSLHSVPEEPFSHHPQ
jgi:hypothetical protein